MPHTVLKVLRTHKDARMPQYQTSGSACFDLHSTDSGIILPGKSMAFGTGLVFEIPAGHVLQVFSRSGHGFKNSVCLINSTGIIDCDYRGEVQVKLLNQGDEPFEVAQGDRIAQAMLTPIPKVELVEVTEVSATERGTGGFGSTG